MFEDRHSTRYLMVRLEVIIPKSLLVGKLVNSLELWDYWTPKN